MPVASVQKLSSLLQIPYHKTEEEKSSSFMTTTGWDPSLPLCHYLDPIKDHYIHDYPNESFFTKEYHNPLTLPFVNAGVDKIPHYGEKTALFQPSVMVGDMGQTDSITKEGVNLTTRGLGFYYRGVAAGSMNIKYALMIDKAESKKSPGETGRAAKKAKLSMVTTTTKVETKKQAIPNIEDVSTIITMIS